VPPLFSFWANAFQLSLNPISFNTNSLHQPGSGGGEFFQFVGTDFGILEVERIQGLDDRRGDDDAREPFVVAYNQIGKNSFRRII